MGKLIRLELYNFKSYRGHHVLLFGDAYFTSIIGPNGSGKSNSMDAISFVLGIKSSHLRSTNLRDLVYRGRVLKTATINEDGSATTGNLNNDLPPTQATQDGGEGDIRTSWVMAVYEDDAGEEQHWKRSITQQGASEYRINDRIVTAQQYNDALEEENILMKARNFLVFQGDVESIASQSPKDLTRLIEQISGSLEYKADYERLKAEAEEAVENQSNQLNRRRGVNAEIRQYQEQKKEADNYARKAEERDQAIITHILWKLFHLNTTIEESSAEIQKHQDELKEYSRGVEKYEEAVEEAKKEHTRAGKDVAKVEKNIKLKEREIEGTQNNLIPVDEKIEVSSKKVQRYQSRIQDVKIEADNQAEIIKRLEKDHKIIGQAQAKWETEFQKTASKKGAQLNEADLHEYNKLKEEVSKRSSASQIKLGNLKRQRKTDGEAVNSLKSNVENAQAKADNMQKDLDDMLERKNTISKSASTTSSEIEKTKKELSSLVSERLRVSQERTETEERLQETLRALLEADSGRKQNEKELRNREMVSTLRRIFPGVKGRVSDLCKPKQKKYADAVSTVLGRHFDAIVVDHEKTAKECIQHLRDQRAGQATFIPLETIQVQTFNTRLKGMHSAVRPAIDTIDYEEPVARAIAYACGNSLVCDDIAAAKYVCFEKGVDAKAVTLNGTVIHKGGLMTGGRGPGDQKAKRWEDAEVVGMQKVKENLMNKLNDLPKANRKGSEEESLQGQLAGLEQRLTFAKDELKALERNIESKGSELAFGKEQLATIQPKFNDKSAALATLDSSLEKLQASVSEVEDEIYRDFCRRLGFSDIREYEAQQGTLQQEAADKRLEFTTQGSKIKSQLEFEQQRVQATKDRASNLRAQVKRDEDMLVDLNKEKEKMQTQLSSLNAELDALNQELSTLTGVHSQTAENLAAQRQNFQKRSKKVETTLRAVNALEVEVKRFAAERYTLLRRCKLEDIGIPLQTNSNSLDALPIDDLVQEGAEPMDIDGGDDEVSSGAAGGGLQSVRDYGIVVDFDSLGESLKESSEEKVEEELQEQIRTLKTELENMSPNTRAMERLETVQNKLRTIEKDFEDARKRARKAKEAFETVMQKRSELFNKAFTHISEQIEPTYRDLTKTANYPMGGKAYLDIEDSEEPYLDGIKYHAMPPLKRFRDMEHLSGGEKTMAALALLFAIHSYQPSPFFVLDEVDAALDNANVSKIANYIRDHAAPGMQFIVISLKTGLFQNSETLVGIYRDQEANSSHSLTLDLRKYR